MQGHLYAIDGMRKGIEISRNGKIAMIAEIRENWPFPAPPRPYRIDELKPLPMKYFQLQNDCDDMPDATF